MARKIGSLIPGILFSCFVAIIAILLSSLIPGDIIGATVMALLVGMALNPILNRYEQLNKGVNFSSKMILRIGIILMGVNLNLSEVLNVSKYAVFVDSVKILWVFEKSIPPVSIFFKYPLFKHPLLI